MHKYHQLPLRIAKLRTHSHTQSLFDGVLTFNTLRMLQQATLPGSLMFASHLLAAASSFRAASRDTSTEAASWHYSFLRKETSPQWSGQRNFKGFLGRRRWEDTLYFGESGLLENDNKFSIN